jgi:Zn finger protein HypA/HybF involved in hydrogenase expression
MINELWNLGDIMGSNGIVKERAQHNIDDKVFKKNHEAIFGIRERLVCYHCNLSSLQKVDSDFICPHCQKEVKFIKEEKND